MPQRITETTGAVSTVTGRTQLVTVITPGWGSSGYYSEEALRQAVDDGVWPEGTKMYIDHPTLAEASDRPERSLQTLAAAFVEDAFWNAQENAVQAKARVFPRWREDLAEMVDSIGVSVYSLAESEPGEAEGRAGMIVKRLIPDPHNTVDYVTVPGRGGRISAVLEAARETTHNDLRGKLRQALSSRYATSEDSYTFVLDSTDDTVWFETDTPDGSRTWMQNYSLEGENLLLKDSPVEVAQVVTWEPIGTEKDSQEASNEDSPAVPAGGNKGKESAMPDITIDEKELTQLRESSSRAAELEQKLADLEAERAAEAASSRVALAESAVKSAFGEDAPSFYLEAARAAASDESYDHAAFQERVAEAAAERQSKAGSGSPNTGNSHVQESTRVEDLPRRTSDDIINALQG